MVGPVISMRPYRNGFDRTYEELKLSRFDRYDFFSGNGFDRTYEELKHSIEHLG